MLWLGGWVVDRSMVHVGKLEASQCGRAWRGREVHGAGQVGMSSSDWGLDPVRPVDQDKEDWGGFEAGKMGANFYSGSSCSWRMV